MEKGKCGDVGGEWGDESKVSKGGGGDVGAYRSIYWWIEGGNVMRNGEEYLW